MIDRRLLNVGLDGTKTWWNYDDTDDSLVIEEEMPTEPLLNANYEERKDKVGVMQKMGDGNHLVANMPMALLFKLKAMGHWEPSDPKGTKLLTWLRDHPRWKTDNGSYV